VKRQPLLKVKTSAKRLHRGIQAFKEWIKRTRNRVKLDVLWERAAARLRGHFNYFGVIFNGARLWQFRFECIRALFKWGKPSVAAHLLYLGGIQSPPPTLPHSPSRRRESPR